MGRDARGGQMKIQDDPYFPVADVLARGCAGEYNDKGDKFLHDLNVACERLFGSKQYSIPERVNRVDHYMNRKITWSFADALHRCKLTRNQYYTEVIGSDWKQRKKSLWRKLKRLIYGNCDGWRD